MDYSQVCGLGALIERLFRIVPREKIHVIIFDDFQTDTRATYQKVLEFLNLPDDQKTNFQKINARKNLMKPNINKLFTCAFFLNRFRYKLGLKWLHSPRLSHWFRGKNVCICYQHKGKKLIDPQFIHELKAHFKQDFLKLSRLLNRDLTHWIN